MSLGRLALVMVMSYPFTLEQSESFVDICPMVSGGFNPERIKAFEQNHVPVDVYAVGSNIFATNVDFTADIVLVDGKPCAKAGRAYSPNPRLEDVD